MSDMHVIQGELTVPRERLAEWRSSTVDPRTTLDLVTTHPAWFDGDLAVRTVDGWLSVLAGAPYRFGDEDGGDFIDIEITGAQVRVEAALGDAAMGAWVKALAALFRSAVAFGGEGALLVEGAAL